jgi:uncharacterized protein YbgA (DUF1722 family)
MRVWDLPAGYLNRQSLLGEHRELHGIYSILTANKSGYANHPETLRWVRRLSGLAMRHRQLVEEMALRGYVDRTPLRVSLSRARWPDVFVTEPVDQISLLQAKYLGKDTGRILLPASAQELWAQHKYSVMARSPDAYRTIGRAVARMRHGADVSRLATDLVWILRDAPSQGRLTNALEHMWGHVRERAAPDEAATARKSIGHLLGTTQRLAYRVGEPFLLASTALSELAMFVDIPRRP